MTWGSIAWGLRDGEAEVEAGALRLLTFPPRPRRQKILKEKAVPMIEGYMFEEHEMIRRAATECMCNLAMSKEVRAARGSRQTVRGGTRAPLGSAAARSVPSSPVAAGTGPL